MAPNTPRSLHAGAEAVIGKGQVAERLMGKFGKVWAQPPPLPAPEALPPAGRSTNCHAPGGHRAVLPAPFEVELLSEQRSTAEKMAGRLRNVEGARPWRAKEEMEVAEAPPSDAALRAMRYFISRARGAGAHRMASLLAQLQAAVRPGQQALSQEDFSRVALAQGLCRCLYDSELVFQQLGGSEASVEQLAEILRGGLDPFRAALVKEAWDVLDPDERGVIQVRHLLRCFDARRLPDVRLGREDAEVALLKFLDGLGVSNRFDRAEDFAMEETAAREALRASEGGGDACPAGHAAFGVLGRLEGLLHSPLHQHSGRGDL
ncbi:unnamed protein product [Effrenium voratum]|nr:unnamed protein product [Effrenium voratum]